MQERFKVLSTAYALLSNPDTRRRYDELGLGYEAGGGGGELGEWQTFKLPFTAFRDRRLHQLTEQVGAPQPVFTLPSC
jgi:curved DNA-binding protein CbpA